MKMGINGWSFPADWPFPRQFALAGRTGFDAYEPVLAPEGPISLTGADRDILAVRTMASDAGIEIASLATGLYWQNNCSSADPAVREGALRLVRRQLEATALLGAGVALVVPGVVHSFFTDEVVPYDAAWERSLDFIGRAAEYAAQCGVAVGVENVWNDFLLSPLEMRTFIDTVGHPAAGVYLDVGNVIRYGFPEHWIRILGRRILRVHVKDYRRDVGTLDGFTDLLSGDVDFPEVMKALRETSYDGYMTVEAGSDETISAVQGDENQDGAAVVERSAAAMRQILGRSET